MRHIKLFEDFLNEAKTLTLFRGQSDEFFNDKKTKGYLEMYGMLFLSDNINNAYFYSNPGRNKIREILVFEVPANIAKVQGVYIDRLGDKIQQLKKDGYSGVTSNVGELSFDKGEVGMFQNYKPVQRFQTNTGKFTEDDIIKLKKLGLSNAHVKKETEL